MHLFTPVSSQYFTVISTKTFNIHFNRVDVLQESRRIKSRTFKNTIYQTWSYRNSSITRMSNLTSRGSKRSRFGSYRKVAYNNSALAHLNRSLINSYKWLKLLINLPTTQTFKAPPFIFIPYAAISRLSSYAQFLCTVYEIDEELRVYCFIWKPKHALFY